MSLEDHVFRTLSDNAGALIFDPETKACAAIDEIGRASCRERVL